MFVVVEFDSVLIVENRLSLFERNTVLSDVGLSLLGVPSTTQCEHNDIVTTERFQVNLSIPREDRGNEANEAKSIQRHIGLDELDRIIANLKPEGVWLAVSVQSEDEAAGVLRRVAAWM